MANQKEREAKKQKAAKAKAKAKAKAAKSEPKKGKDGKAPKPSIWSRFVTYLKNVKTEMQRVVWPTRKELLNASLIVIGALVFFGVLIAIVDNVIIIPLDLLSSLGAN